MWGGRWGACKPEVETGNPTLAREPILQKSGRSWNGVLEEEGAELGTQLCAQETLPLGSLSFPSCSRVIIAPTSQAT